MTPEQFLAFADPLPEPMLLLTGYGVVLAGNSAIEGRLNVKRVEVIGRHLAESVQNSPDEVSHYLQLCSRSRSMVLGSLSLRTQSGHEVACRIEGTLLRPRVEEVEAILMLRLLPKDSRSEQFLALNQQIEQLNREVQRRKNAEAAALRQTEQLRVTLHSIGDGVIVTDADGNVSTLNPIAQQLTGWTLDEAIGRSLLEVFQIINESTRQTVENPASRSLKEGVIVGLANHTLLIAKDGKERPIDDSAAPIRNGEGNVVGSVLVFRDISDRKASEMAIMESESRFRQLADAMPQIIWTAGSDGNIDYMNRQWRNFTGLPETVGNAGWSKILHPDEIVRAREKWAASVQSGSPFEMELRLMDRRYQAYRWHLLRTIAVHDETGRVVRWFGTSTDIDAQKRAEQSSRFLAEASAALARVVDYESTLRTVANLAVPYFADWSAVDVVGENGTLKRLAVAHQDADKVRLAHELMAQYPPDPDSETGAYSVLRTSRPEIIFQITDEMLVQGTKDERHLDLIRSLGLQSYICVPLVVAGRPLGVLTFATAESGRIYSQVDLALANDLAYRAGIAIENTRLYQALRDTDRRKDEFLATLAHELRNPLAPICNSLQILKMPRVDSETLQQTRDTMDRQVQQLVRLVDDLLDVSRVMTGKIELRREPVELASVIARAVETAQTIIEAHGHRLDVVLPNGSLLLHADPVRLAQVVSNLLTNAAKYTEVNGCIWLTAVAENGQAVLRVRDSGIGIASEMLPHIFGLFFQVDHASTKAQGGLGIGLTLVKNLVEMHEGTVEACSSGLGEGSEFIIRLPLLVDDRGQAHDSASKEPGQVPLRSSGHRLLIVDDNQDAAISLAILLRLQGHEVRVAHSGEAALEITKHFIPNAVFLDIGMPAMDGYEVARRMRQQPEMEKVVLAALTGWGQSEDRLRTAEAGFDHHLVKPPELKMVESVLEQLKSSRS